MSIEMDNPKGALELVDAASNLVEQMYLNHMIHDEIGFKKAHEKASRFLFEALNEIDK
jgi:hypothetical protein